MSNPSDIGSQMLSIEAEGLKKILQSAILRIQNNEGVLQTRLPALEEVQSQIQSEVARLSAVASSQSLGDNLTNDNSTHRPGRDDVESGGPTLCQSSTIDQRLEHDRHFMQKLAEKRSQTVAADISEVEAREENKNDSNHAMHKEVLALRSRVEQLHQEHDNDIMGALETRHQVEDIRMDLVQLHGKAAESISTIQASDLNEAVRRNKKDCILHIDEVEQKLGCELKTRLQENETNWTTWRHQHDVKDAQWHDVVRGQLRMFAKAKEVANLKATCDLEIQHLSGKIEKMNAKVGHIIDDVTKLKRSQAFSVLQRQLSTWRRKQIARGFYSWRRSAQLMQKQELMIKSKRRIVRLFAGRQAGGFLKWGFYRWRQCTEHLREKEERQLKSAKAISQRLQDVYLYPQQLAFRNWRMLVATAALDEMYQASVSTTGTDLPDHEHALSPHQTGKGQDGSTIGANQDGLTEPKRQGSRQQSARSPRSPSARSVSRSTTPPALKNLRSVSPPRQKAKAPLQKNVGALQKVIRGLGNDTRGAIDVLTRELERVKVSDLPKLRNETASEHRVGMSYVMQKMEGSAQQMQDAVVIVKSALTEKNQIATDGILKVTNELKNHEESTASKIKELENDQKKNFSSLFIHKEEMLDKTYDLEIGLSQNRNRVTALDSELGKANKSADALLKHIELLEQKQEQTDTLYDGKFKSLVSRLEKYEKEIVATEMRCKQLEGRLQQSNGVIEALNNDSKNQFQMIHKGINTAGVRKPPYHRLVGECLLFEKDSHERKFVIGFNSTSNYEVQGATQGGKSTSFASAIVTFAQDYAAWIAYQSDHEAVVRGVCGTNPDDTEYANDEIDARRIVLVDALRKGMNSTLEEAHSCPGALRLEARSKFTAKLVEATEMALSRHERAMTCLNTRFGKRGLVNGHDTVTCMGCDRPLRIRGDGISSGLNQRTNSAMERMAVVGNANGGTAGSGKPPAQGGVIKRGGASRRI
jgi:hypothetical protein